MRSSMVCRARKTLPCQQNHFSRCSWVPISLARSVVGSWVRAWRGRWQALGHVGHDGDPHGQVEPVQQVLGLGVEVAGNVADVLAAVGEEGDLLVGLHALGSKHLEQAPFGFGVVGLHIPEAGGPSVGRDGLAGDDLEPAVGAGLLLAGVDVAAVQADYDRQVRAGEFLAVTLAGVDEAGPLLAELALQPVRDRVDCAAYDGRVQAPAQRQQLTEQVRGDAVGDQGGEAGLLVGQLGGGPLGQQPGQRLEGPGGLVAAAAVPTAGTREAQPAEQAAHHDRPGVLVPARHAAVWAGHLLGDRGVGLLLDHGVLHRREQVLRLSELQAEGVRSQVVTVKGEHLPDHGRGLGVVVGMHDHLHAELHLRFPPTVCTSTARPRRAWLQVRRSKRSRPSSGARPASSSRSTPARS